MKSVFDYKFQEIRNAVFEAGKRKALEDCVYKYLLSEETKKPYMEWVEDVYHGCDWLDLTAKQFAATFRDELEPIYSKLYVGEELDSLLCSVGNED